MNLIGHSIYSYWGPRPETPQAIARRFLRLIDRLAPIDRVFGHWIYALDEEPVMLDDLRSDMANVVERHASRADDGEPTPIAGYSIAVINSLEKNPHGISIYVKAGSCGTGHVYINHASIETFWLQEPDPAIITFPIFRAALLVLAETFEVTWCSAYPRDIMPLWRGEALFSIGWMSYVSPRFAPLITPPPTAIVEYRPNGGLLMAATNETFITANPKHLAIARDIEAAIAPLNALPWPPDAEPA